MLSNALRRFYPILLVGACALWGFQVTSLTHKPAEKSAENEDHRVELTSYESSPSYKLVFQVVAKKTNQSREFVLEERYASVKDLMLVEKAKLVVSGELPRGGNIISVVDLRELKLQNTIWKYDYAFSPTKRFLIYQSHYPRMGLPESRRSILLLYDLRRPAPETRLSSISPPENVGFPVFPEANAKLRSYDVRLEVEHLYLSPFLWPPDERNIVFIEFSTHDEQNYLAVINLSAGVENPRIRRKRINVMGFANIDIMTLPTKADLKDNPYKFTVLVMRWSGLT
ncbi:MAG: hypothetical protein ACREBU_15485, partial [Nitrososphaera sp.]